MYFKFHPATYDKHKNIQQHLTGQNFQRCHIIQTKVRCSDDIPEKYGRFELRQNKKYKHTP